MGSNRRPEYLRDRQVCPKCGNHPGKLTDVRYDTPPDLNVVQCYDCNWVGTVDEMKPKQEKKMTVTVEAVIAAYIKTRDEIEAKEKAVKAEVAELKAVQEKRAMWLLGSMEKLGATSIKGAAGTAFVDYKDSATVADSQAFLGWVHEDWDTRKTFLENRVSKTAVKQRLDDGET